MPKKQAALYPCFGYEITVKQAADFACVSPTGFYTQMKKLGGSMEAAMQYYEKKYGG